MSLETVKLTLTEWTFFSNREQKTKGALNMNRRLPTLAISTDTKVQYFIVFPRSDSRWHGLEKTEELQEEKTRTLLHSSIEEPSICLFFESVILFKRPPRIISQRHFRYNGGSKALCSPNGSPKDWKELTRTFVECFLPPSYVRFIV